MSQYKTEKSGANGTVTVTNGSSMVTGSGTAFLSNVQAGNSFKIQEQNAIYNINAVISDTEIIISPVYAGITASAGKFAIARDFTESGLYEFSIGDVDWYFLMSLNMRNIDTTVANQNLGNIFKGTWDASANIPVIPTAAPENIGWSYTVSVAGTYNSVNFAIGDIIRSNGVAWFRIPASSTSAPTTWGDGVYVGTVSPTLISYDAWLAAGKVGYWGFIDISSGSSTSIISVTSHGGAVIGGSATISSSSSSSNVSVQGAGGAIVGGSATISKTATHPVTSTGGVIVGGAATISSSTAGTSSVSVLSTGGVVVGGSATVALTRTQAITSTGGVVVGGSATVALTRTQAITSTGGVVAGGSATISSSVAASIPGSTGGSPSLSNNPGALTVDWSGLVATITGATSYDIGLGTTNNPSSISPLLLNVTGTRRTMALNDSFTNSYPYQGTTYYAFVRGRNSAGVSASWSNASSAAVCAGNSPTIPVITISTITVTSISINKTSSENGSGVTYNLGYSTSPISTYASATTKITNVTSFPKNVTGLTTGQTYYFILQAVNTYGTFESSSIGATATAYASGTVDITSNAYWPTTAISATSITVTLIAGGGGGGGTGNSSSNGYDGENTTISATGGTSIIAYGGGGGGVPTPEGTPGGSAGGLSDSILTSITEYSSNNGDDGDWGGGPPYGVGGTINSTPITGHGFGGDGGNGGTDTGVAGGGGAGGAVTGTLTPSSIHSGWAAFDLTHQLTVRVGSGGYGGDGDTVGASGQSGIVRITWG